MISSYVDDDIDISSDNSEEEPFDESDKEASNESFKKASDEALIKTNYYDDILATWMAAV